MSKQQIENYIREFDQRTHLLIGIFEKASEKLIGFIRVDIDEANRRYLTSSFIGEPEYRDKGILQAVGVPLGYYFLEELGMQTCLTTVLSHNERVLHYLRKTGWHFDGVAPGHAKAPDGKSLDLYYFSYTREMWDAAKKRVAAEREVAAARQKRN
jgi:RimJ/RimL family protein N-acetyltransferase